MILHVFKNWNKIIFEINILIIVLAYMCDFVLFCVHKRALQ